MTAADELVALRNVAAMAGRLYAHGSYVFRNGDDGRQLPFNGTAERTAYAFVVATEDADELSDALAELDRLAEES